MQAMLMPILSTLKAKPQKHIMFGNFFQLQILLIQRKADPMNACCMFCEKSFSGCSTARAAAHILARPVMGQSKAGIQSCVAINKKDDDRRGALRQAQKTVSEVIRVKELAIVGTKRKQQVMEDLVISPTKQQSVESSLLMSLKCLLGIMKMFKPSKLATASY
jgi:hypothetical protein